MQFPHPAKKLVHLRFYKWLVFVVVALATFLSTTDTIVSISLPELAKTFNVDASVIIWVALSYFVVSMGLMFTMGWVSDGFGRNRVLIVGLLLITISHGLSALAQDVYQLIVLRSIAGIGSAMLIASSVAILVATFPKKERGLAMGLISGSAGVGLASGPLIGGFLVDMFDWRAIFWIRLPIGAISFLLALMLLQWKKGTGVPKSDIAGATTLFITLASFLLAINQAGRIGLYHPVVFLFGIVATIGLITLIKVELRADRPVLDLKLFRLLPYSIGMLTLIALYIGVNTVNSISPFLLINGLGFSASKAGLFIGLYHGMRLPISPGIGILSDKLGSPALMLLGLFSLGLGLWMIGLTVADGNEVTLWIWFLLAGAGIATFDPANGRGIMASVPNELLGNGSAAVATGRQIGLTIGGILATAIFASTSSSAAKVAPTIPVADLPSSAILMGGGNAMVISAIIALMGTLMIFALFKKSSS